MARFARFSVLRLATFAISVSILWSSFRAIPSPQVQPLSDPFDQLGQPWTIPYPETYGQLLEYQDIFGFGQEGRDGMDTLLREMAAHKKEKPLVLLEVGVWLGQSVARWLQTHPNIRVVAVDPFCAPSWNHSKLEKVPYDLKSRFGTPLFNGGLAQYYIGSKVRDAPARTILFTGFFPDAAEPLFKSNLEIDVFYLDGGKQKDTDAWMQFVAASLGTIFQHYPKCIIAGDDWQHQLAASELFRKFIRKWALEHGRTLHVIANRTWFLSDSKENLPFLAAVPDHTTESLTRF